MNNPQDELKRFLEQYKDDVTQLEKDPGFKVALAAENVTMLWEIASRVVEGEEKTLTDVRKNVKLSKRRLGY